MDILAMGEVLIDLTQTGVNEEGVPQYAANPGGAPANLAVAASRLGASTGFIGKVGKDSFGDYLKSVLEENAVDVRGLKMDLQHPTTLAVVSVDKTGERSFGFYRKLCADTMLEAGELDLSLLKEAKFFHFGSVSLTSDPEREATLTAVREAKKAGCIITYDPNYREKLWEDETRALKEMKAVLPLVDILKISDEELVLLTGKKDPAEATEEFRELGISLIFVTLGEKGAFYRLGERTGTAPGFKVAVGDTNGAGDTFFGAVLAKLSQTEDFRKLSEEELREVIAFGNRAAAVTVSRHGAINAMPLPGEVDRIKQRTVNIILLGAPGCGKGSLSERLEEQYLIRHFSTGDMLREAIAKGTELGKQAEELINQGNLVNDDIVLGLIREKLDSAKETPEEGEEIINLFDGYPRTLSQAGALEELLKERKLRVDGVLSMVCDEETVARRTVSRCLCRNCSFIGNIHRIGIAEDGKRYCPRCGGLIYQRKDDRPEVFRSRMDTYKKMTEPLNQYYSDKRILYRVDSSGALSSTEAGARKVLDSLQKGLF